MTRVENHPRHKISDFLKISSSLVSDSCTFNNDAVESILAKLRLPPLEMILYSVRVTN